MTKIGDVTDKTGKQNPKPSAPGPDDKTQEEPVFKLSLTKLGVGAVSSVTAAFLGSRLGVAGTLVGAAVGSVAVGVVSTSLKAAVHRVKKRPKWVATSILVTAAASFVIGLILVTGQELTTGSSLDGRPGSTTLSHISKPNPSEETPDPEESNGAEVPPPSEPPVQATPEPTPGDPEPPVEPNPTPTPTPDADAGAGEEAAPTAPPRGPAPAEPRK